MQNQSYGPAVGADDAPLVIFEHLYPAILQSFVVILLGYSSSRWNLIPAYQCQGLAKYIGYFALPALLLQKMATLTFGAVDWLFWTSILVAKGTVFVLVFVVTVVVGMPRRLATAAIFSMFATQSNDFALGYPIFAAVYESTHPELLQYIYLFGPISLLCLNPWGFLSLEVEKNQSQQPAEASKLRMVLRVGWGMITNPVVVSVLLGVIVNVLANQKVPGLLEPVVGILADSFSASALFYLGVSLSGKLHNMSARVLLPTMLLISAKLFVMPLMVVLSVSVFRPGHGSNLTSLDVYANYAFLYGTIPTTPSVFIYATQYAISQDMIASSMFLCTFMSAPLMFMAGTSSMITYLTHIAIQAILNKASFIISCMGLVSSVLLLGLFIHKQSIKAIPHQFTTNLVISQVLITVGVIAAGISAKNLLINSISCANFVLVLGTLASRCWTMCIAVILCIVKMKRSTNLLNLRWFNCGFYLLGWGAPVILAITWFLVTRSPWNHDKSVQEWEKQQALGSIFLHLLSLTVTVGALLCFSKVNESQRGTGTGGDPGNQRDQTISDGSQGDLHSVNVVPALDDSDSQGDVVPPEKEDSQPTDSTRHDLQLWRHLTLVMLLVASMLVSLVLNVLKLSVVDPFPGVLLALGLLDGALLYGQGFYTLLVFGLWAPRLTTHLQQCTPRIWQFEMLRSTHPESSC